MSKEMMENLESLMRNFEILEAAKVDLDKFNAKIATANKTIEDLDDEVGKNLKDPTKNNSEKQLRAGVLHDMYEGAVKKRDAQLVPEMMMAQTNYGTLSTKLAEDLEKFMKSLNSAKSLEKLGISDSSDKDFNKNVTTIAKEVVKLRQELKTVTEQIKDMKKVSKGRKFTNAVANGFENSYRKVKTLVLRLVNQFAKLMIVVRKALGANKAELDERNAKRDTRKNAILRNSKSVSSEARLSGKLIKKEGELSRKIDSKVTPKEYTAVMSKIDSMIKLLGLGKDHSVTKSAAEMRSKGATMAAAVRSATTSYGTARASSHTKKASDSKKEAANKPKTK